MHIDILNPKEDQYGGSRENIFLAFDDGGSYLGSAYAYPKVNHHQTCETPYLIFLGVNIADGLEEALGAEVRQRLFDKVFSRARELRLQRPDLTARIYSGFEYDREKLEFYVKNGFEEDYSIVMEADISEGFNFVLPGKMNVIENQLNSEEKFKEYKMLYDEIFVSPLDEEAYSEQQKQPHFKNLSFLIEGSLAGGCTIFERDGFGYVETVFILPEYRGRGLSKTMMNYIFDCFLSRGLRKTKLEVWKLNRRAVELYKSCGYKEVGKNLMFPGITL